MSTTKTRILVVEDESLVAEDLRERLTQMGYEVCYVTDSGEDAADRAAEFSPDLALLDIHLRGKMDGIAVADFLRRTMGVPAVFLTAHADRATLARAGKVEPFGYVLKPFDERELQAAVEMALYRYEAERRLYSMERWLAATLQSIGDGVVAVDPERRVTFMNPVAESITGWSRQEALGRPCEQVLDMAREGEKQETDAVLALALREGLVINLDTNYLLRTRLGELLPIDNSIAPIRDDEGQITGAVVIFRDSTHLRRVADERRKMEMRMQDAQKLESLGILANGIAHDFNNLLTAITGNLSLCKGVLPAGSPFSGYLQGAEDAALRAGQLCAQMLAYAGSGELVLQLFEFSDFVQETLQLMQIGISKRAHLVMDFARNLPWIEADRGQLQQVVMNLVINAAEALDDGAGTIRVRTDLVHANSDLLSKCQIGADLPPGRYLLLEVSDSGCGMMPATMARIFDPFFTTKTGGRGLGLAAALGIVRRHGGALAVESTPGAGSTFRIFLFPSSKAAPAREKPPVPLHWHGSGRVLLVDDELSIRLALTALLEFNGFEVVSAADGEEALRIYNEQRERIIAVLTDLTMPGKSGLEVYNETRRCDPRLPILLISGYTREAAEEGFRFDPHAAFLAKPFTGDELRRSLAALLPASGG